MASARLGSVAFRGRRRWSFAGCTFDEANWSLVVGGRQVAIETKPLELLRVFLLRPGDLLSKDELLDAVWPDVAVVEASLPTAVRKLRAALGDDERDTPIIQTVPRIGYRLGVPVEVVELAEPSAPGIAAVLPELPGKLAFAAPSAVSDIERPSATRGTRLLSVGGWLGIAVMAVVALLAVLDPAPRELGNNKTVTTYTQAAAGEAIRKLDIGTIQRMLAAGWNPAEPWDKEGNHALNILLNRCEWDPAHDRRRMLLMARTLIEGGAPINRRNAWGDTAYSIAKADRYCGADHPVTRMIEALCYGGSRGPKDRCLATYELSVEQRQAQGLPARG